MLDVVTHWVAHYGVAIVAAFLFIESTGIPVPGETALVTAAALAGRGTLSIFAVVIAACIGTFVGGQTGYWIGAKEGRSLIARYGRWIKLTPERMQRTEIVFARHGGKTVLLGRFVAFMRSFIGIFAGIVGMPAGSFAVVQRGGRRSLGAFVQRVGLRVRAQSAAARPLHRAREPCRRDARRAHRRRRVRLEMVPAKPNQGRRIARSHVRARRDQPACEPVARESSARVAIHVRATSRAASISRFTWWWAFSSASR